MSMHTQHACAVRATLSSTGDKFRPVSNFTELHALTLAARSYTLLVPVIEVLTVMLLCFVCVRNLCDFAIFK